LLALVLVNGVLAGAEIAIVSVRRTRVRELVEAGGARAQALQRLRAHPEGFLATVQIGITVVGATAGAFGGARFAAELAPALSRVAPIAPYAEPAALALVVALVSYASLVIGELVPKSLALRSAEPYALWMARPLSALARLARPLVWFLTASSNVVLRLFGDRTNFLEARVSTEELRQLMTEATEAGTVHPHAGEIASRALDFAALTAADVMVPRNRVVAVRRSASPDELRRVLLEQGHTRMPVYDGEIDDIVGYISIKDVLALAWEHRLIVLEDILRPPYFVPELKRAVDLLQEMRDRRQPFAIVVDEQGGFAGIVTLEDLVEELVGEIFSEHAPRGPDLVRREADGSAVVQGSATIRDLNRALDLGLPEDGEWTTVAGLCLVLVGRIPAVGEKVTTPNGVVLEILDASPRRIRQVRIVPASAQGTPAGERA
jgi:putative hemolysin